VIEDGLEQFQLRP